jgi:hypothetical protein
MKFFITTLTALVTVMVTTTAQAFCGFYVARADTSLFNRASQVVLVQRFCRRHSSTQHDRT